MLLLSSADIFIINFLNFFFKNSIRVSNGLDPDQEGHNVGPDLGPILFSKVISRQQKSLLKSIKRALI